MNDDTYLCETCGGTGRIPSDRLSVSNPKPKIVVSPPSRDEWLRQRRTVDVDAWVEQIKQENPGVIDLLPVVLALAARVQYLEEVIHDEIIVRKKHAT
jgi:hypothetical protein